jgi:hypothetical protein
MEKYNEKNRQMFMKNFMEFHGKFHGISWNSMELHGIFHGNFQGIFHGNFHRIPWNSMEFMEFHGKFHELTERFSPGLCG